MNNRTTQHLLAVPVNAADHILGTQTAKVTLVEYGDFECPQCAQAFPAVHSMLKHFGHQLRFVFRQFPLRETHPHAELAAEAAEAAGAQGKFWPMHNLLFENQLHLKPKSLRRYAELAELDMERYDYEMNDYVYLQHVQEDMESGNKSGVRATPTFFINGVMHDGSFAIDRMQAAIDAALGS